MLSGNEGFIGYGAVFEADGVVVDNYSVRSNNGQAMFWTNPSVNAQMNALLGYDLVILQYGLNIMQTGVSNYTNYAGQIEKMVAYVRQCFPTAAVLVLGVSDRSVKTDAGFEPMDAIPHMLGYQRGAAENTERPSGPPATPCVRWAAWSSSSPTAGAGKDFTHINYAGRAGAWRGRSSTPSTPGEPGLYGSGSRTHPPAGRAGRARQACGAGGSNAT